MGDTITSGRWVPEKDGRYVWRDVTVSPSTTDDIQVLYSDLADWADEPAQATTIVPMSAQTPTEFTIGDPRSRDTENPWFISPQYVKYLFGGALQTANWTRTEGSDNGIITVSHSGAASAVVSDLGLPIVGQTDSDSGILVGYDNFRDELYIRPDSNAAANSFDNATQELDITGGTQNFIQNAAPTTGEWLWANPNSVNVLSVQAGTRPYVYQDGAKITDWGDYPTNPIGIHVDGEFDILLLVRQDGTLIDNGIATFFARRAAALGDWFEADLSGGGRVTIPLTNNPDTVNDGIGHHNMAFNNGSGATLLVGEIFDDDADSETAGVVTNINAGAGAATGDFDYVLIRGLNQFSTLDNLTAVTSGKTFDVNGAPTNLTPVTDTDITFTHAGITRDINNGAGARPYSIDVNPASKSWERVYQRGKYITRRGSAEAIDGINGESYRGSTLQVEYSGQTINATEGNTLTFSPSGATGIIVAAHDDGATGDYILRNVRGTPTTADTISDGSSDGDVDSLRTIPTLKFAPLGNLAGTLWQGAPGMVPVLANIASGREKDYTLIDDDGVVQNPPNTVAVVVSDSGADDWVLMARTTVASGGVSDINISEYTSHATNNAEGDQTLEVQSAVSQEAPPAGRVRVRYALELDDYYNYDSYGTGPDAFTLTSIPTGTVDAADATGITLTDTGAGDFINDGVLPGMLVQNTTDGSIGTVKTVDSATVITLDGAGLAGGTENDWDISDGYEINRLVRTYDGSDTVWVPFVDEKSTGVDISTTIIQTVNINVVTTSRQGPGQAAADEIQPFEQSGVIGANGLTQPVARQTDPIAS
jgi:hypothetical protein